MKRSKFTDEQILAIVREGEAGRKVADLLSEARPLALDRGRHVGSRAQCCDETPGPVEQRRLGRRANGDRLVRRQRIEATFNLWYAQEVPQFRTTMRSHCSAGLRYRR